MLRIEQIQDTETLRQVALLLDRENRRLHDRIEKLIEEISRLKGEDASAAQRQLEFLKELLAQRERALFGASSERRARPETEEAPAPERAPRRGHGPKAQPRLPVVDRIYELDEPDRMCPKCGGELTEIAGQFEDAEEVTVVERRFVLVRHRRKKYRCSCNGCVETAPAAPRLAAREGVRGTRYSPEFAVEVAVAKYLDHLPLERQVRIMWREGLDIDSQTLWDQLQALARVLEPSHDGLRRHVLSSEVVGADESWWRLMSEKGSKRWWAWGLSREDAVVYRILDSRSQEAARQVLDGYRGIVMADGYGAYDALSRSNPGFTLAHCWAHVRRKFVEAEPHYPGPCQEVLDLIGELFAVEREVPSLNGLGEETGVETLRLRARLRDERSRPISGTGPWGSGRFPRAALARPSPTCWGCGRA